LFDLPLSENLDNTLLKLCEFIPSIRVARLFDFTNVITENKNSQQYVVLKTEMIRVVHWSFKSWVFTFWNLSPEVHCRVALTQTFTSLTYQPPSPKRMHMLTM